MQAWHKKEKAKQIKKGKTEKAKIRTEKLARRNPDRIQKQIDELVALQESGRISTHDKKQLVELEKDLAAVKKAKETLGPQIEEERAKRREAGSTAERGGRDGGQKAGVKRAAGADFGSSNFQRRGPGRPQFDRAGDESDSGESTSSSVRDIPMPSGTPPPLPRQQRPEPEAREGPRQPHALPEKPAAPVVKTTYESAPILRDLRKEAAAFVPAAVKRKLEAQKAKEEREAEEMKAADQDAAIEGLTAAQAISMRINAAPDVDEELTRFQAEMEEVEDEEA
ncbi:hypothetical protein DFP73DRAFT_590511 [Morchella snyderi]|nr:hypothetical protein DFP73DRAFT_590511 [Morchella snyderi]